MKEHNMVTAWFLNGRQLILNDIDKITLQDGVLILYNKEGYTKAFLPVVALEALWSEDVPSS